MLRSRLLWKFVFVSALVAAVVIAHNLVLLWRADRPEADLEVILWQTIALGLLTVIAVLLVSVVHLRFVRHSLRRLLKGVQRVRSGEYPRLLVEGPDDELGELIRGFNQMVEELRSRDDKLKNWAGEREIELVRLSRSLEEERERLVTVLESIGDGLIVLDSEGQVLMVNRRVSEIFGVPPDALTRTNLPRVINQVRHRLVNPEQTEEKVRELLAQPDKMDEVLLELDQPGGQAIRLYCMPVRGADGKVLGRIATALDLGRERELERLKAEFLSTISHELRTPLTSVKGALGLIRGGATGPLTSDMRELLDIAMNNAERLIQVINDILDVFQLERGQALISPVIMSLSQSIARATQHVAHQAESRRLSVETHLSETLPAIKGDPRRVEQILINLLSNAIKFSPPNQRIVVTAERQDRSVVVSVQDFGRGMTPEFQERLFQKFEHEKDSLTRESQGAGLGLAICRYIVEAHGGHIWCESTEGRGSTFHFTLPAADGVGVPPLLASQQDATRPGPRRLILVIDDDEDVARVIAFVFESEGHRVLRAHNGAEAIELARKHHPDMITLDLLMPDVDGYTVLRRLRANAETARIPIVCISVRPDSEKAIAEGATYYLEKPVDIEKLREVAARAIAAPPAARVAPDDSF
ncbi:MAG: ATP-binding protein [Candidatus Acidiferrales bacterium]